jgi:TonB family protein
MPCGENYTHVVFSTSIFNRGRQKNGIMKPKDIHEPEESLFKTGTSVTDAPSWFSSLVAQLKQLREERRNPPPAIEVTAQRDPAALDKLLEAPSPLASLLAQIRSSIDDFRHPRKIETTAAPVEVEEIWSKPKRGVPGLLSIGAHVVIVGLLLIPWSFGDRLTPKVNETAVMVYTPMNLVLNLPPKADESGGGGGGGRKSLTPPSQGRLPRAADKQLAPPDPEPPKNPDPTLIVEPTVVAPQLANLPKINLLNLGDPEGVPGPPSPGPGVGGGIGSGTGRGVGRGDGPGVGPGEDGGYGGGIFRVGGGISPPVVIKSVDPLYSEEARKARYQGTVVLEAIVRTDGTCDVVRIVRSLGFGLDEQAVVAIKQYKFKPALRNGVPVPVSINFEINFNLR